MATLLMLIGAVLAFVLLMIFLPWEKARKAKNVRRPTRSATAIPRSQWWQKDSHNDWELPTADNSVMPDRRQWDFPADIIDPNPVAPFNRDPGSINSYEPIWPNQ